MKRALADREQRGCHHFLLNQVAQIVWNSVLENQAILSLDDPDPQTAASAVQALSAHGSAAVEPFLWRRLEQWSERWRGRTSEFEIHPITGGVPNPESLLGPALFRGIASARSWILDEPRRQRLSQLCLDEPCRKEWAQRRQLSTLMIDVSNGGGAYPAAFRVDLYQAPTFDALQKKTHPISLRNGISLVPAGVQPVRYLFARAARGDVSAVEADASRSIYNDRAILTREVLCCT